jgi:SAM-dependent methyltransferase
VNEFPVIVRSYIRNVVRSLKKPAIGDDPILKAIDDAPSYQKIPLPLFDDLSRLKYIKWYNKQTKRNNFQVNEIIDLGDQDVLDLGCNIGYFGWNNAQSLEAYRGIDHDENCIFAAEAISDEFSYKNLDYARRDVIKYLQEDIDAQYDVCLFLSLYHHILRQCGFDVARTGLDTISKHCDILYFDMGQVTEKSNKARAKWQSILPDQSPEQFITEEVLTNTDYTESKIVGETDVGNSKRLLFKFTK